MNYYNNLPYNFNQIRRTSPSPIATRFVPGGFILPFALGFLSAPLLLPNQGYYYNKYPPYNQYNYYQPIFPY